jgi:hypothetical protein
MMMKLVDPRFAFSVVLLLAGASMPCGTQAAKAVATAAPAIDFNRDIRPILSDNCFACHGPDDKARKAKLRFDLHDEALQPAKSGERAIVPGDTAHSELIRRITTKDPDDVMPPPKSGKKLTSAQVDLLQRWIAQGAPWKVHWAYEPPRRPVVPAVKEKRWARNPIDHFILERLEHEKLKPSPEAEKTTLIRRATLDLTGLPPSPEEVDAFLADSTPGAYEKVVDRLLESPRYGEHMARYWLDAARYADSHGYHIDSERSIWKWRDWVVNAFNQNMPFDEFTVEQLAGDLLPEATVDQKIGSGYVRCNMSTGEGGAITEEYQAKYTFDRVETTSTIWMGLTLTCARCHTHKYDPITHREYYGMYAFFNNLNESVMDGNKPNPDPFIKVPTSQQTSRQGELKTLLADGQKQLDRPMPEMDRAQTEWVSQWHEKLSTGWTPLAATSALSTATNGATLRALEDKTVLAEGANPGEDVYELAFHPAAGSLAALRLETLPHASLPNGSAARAEDGRFRLSEFEAELVPIEKDRKPGKPKKLKFTQAVADASEPKFEVGNAIDGKPDTGWGVDAAAITNGHTALFALGEPVRVTTNTELRVRLRFNASQSKRAIGHFRLAAAQNDELVEWLNPPKLDPWQLLGPLKAENPYVALTNVLEPEKKFDLKGAYPGVREEVKWTAKPDFEDGKANLLVNELHGVHGVYYLHRTLTVPAARKLEVTLRADEVFRLWVNDKLVAERPNPEKPGEGPLQVTVDLKKGENRFLWKVVTQVGASYATFNKDLGDENSVSADVAAILATTRTLNGPQQTKVRNFYRRQHSPEFKSLFDNVDKWREENTALDRQIPTTMVAKEMEKPRDTTILMRGEYDKKGDKVSPGVPAILPPLPIDTDTNRLGLARWLASPSHPLTARVTMNRFWQQYFGIGLVKTTEDFGVQGERPSHPQLLDWLALEFAAPEGGAPLKTPWDVKRMQRLIVTSATYRQSSRVTPELLARDPENRLLARGPRFRVDGEVLRDTALFLGGILVEKRGGKAVKPFEPPGLWEAVSFNNSQKYVPDAGDAQHRRSLYTYWKRQSPPANMLIFDAPTREYCVVRRPRTNTPLQALALLNDPQIVEASRALAQRILLEGGRTAAGRIAYGFRLTTSRKASPEEISVLAGILEKQLADFRQDKAAAEKLLQVGAFKARADLDPAELAAWTTLASLMLNLDETVTKG